MRAETRRADSNHERGNRRNENGNQRIRKGSDRQRPLPNKLGAINKENPNKKEVIIKRKIRQIVTILTLFLLKSIVLCDIIFYQQRAMWRREG